MMKKKLHRRVRQILKNALSKRSTAGLSLPLIPKFGRSETSEIIKTMLSNLIELENIKLQNVLSEFKYVDEPVDGFVNFVVGTFEDVIVVGGFSGKNRIDGALFFEKTNLAVFNEMLADVLAGKLQRPKESRFEHKDDIFFYKNGADDLRVGARTVWTHPQREPPTQVSLQNVREHKNGLLGERYAMQFSMTELTAQKLLAELQKIENESGQKHCYQSSSVEIANL